MRTTIVAMFVFACSSYSAWVHADEPKAPGEAKTYLNERGPLLFADDFSKPLGKDWRVGKGKWELSDGVLRGAELPADMHGAVIRHARDFHNIVLQYDFKLDGAKHTTLSFNGPKGHICRVLIGADGFAVKKDSSDHNKTDKGALLDRNAVTIKPGVWHTMLVEIQGKEMLACLDGTQFAYGTHPGIDVTMANFGLTVAKQAVAFRNLSAWQATPNKSWEESRTKILEARKK